MEVVPGDPTNPVIWEEYCNIIQRYEPDTQMEWMERSAFYERAKRAYAVIATSEKALYANLIFKKGVL